MKLYQLENNYEAHTSSTTDVANIPSCNLIIKYD